MNACAKRYFAHPAHPPPIGRDNRPITLFVSLRVADPASVNLATRDHCEAMERAWRLSADWHVGNYLVMPDHVHFFCAPAVLEHPPVRRWLGYWKRVLGQEDARLKGVFLADCWDTQIRDREHYAEKLDYVRRNPERKNLVAPQASWPFCGVVFPLQGW
jgi:putative transposase